MKKLVFLFFLVISITGLSASVEIKMPSFDKKNGIHRIYFYSHDDKTEVTVVFWDEDYPNFLLDLVYDVYRFFKWGRFYDIETFFVERDKIVFPDDFCPSVDYFQIDNLHNYAGVPIEKVQKNGEKIVVYVSTWNHMFSTQPLSSVEYQNYSVKEEIEARRIDVERIFSFKHSFRLLLTVVLSLTMFVLSVLTILLKSKSKNAIFFKASTTLCALLIAVMNSSHFEWFISAGLFFGLLGDIFLENPEKFKDGMVMFLIGHILYSLGFGLKFTVPPVLIFGTIYFTLMAIYFLVLHRHLGEYRLAIFIYVLAIATMMVFSFGPLYLGVYYIGFLLPLSAGLFVFSDLCIAYDRFVRKLPARNLIILSTYFFAQWVISLSNLF